MLRELLAAFVIGASIGGFTLAVIVGGCTERRYRLQAIEHGAAEYDSTTGQWRWKAPTTLPK